MFRLKSTMLYTVSFVALATAATAQTSQTPADQSLSGNPETVVVTGSRVISDIANSPTPVTALSAQQLAATTPQDITMGIQESPMFLGSTGPNAANDRGGGTEPNSIDTLNLRNFGTNRNLILFDGHRVAPMEPDGSVDVDVLPQMLVQRVDVVTGGASAVYGSDAVTGVVNYVLNKSFNGIKYEANGGLSQEAQQPEYQLGVAAGSELFGGRGHIEATVRFQHTDAVAAANLPYGKNGNAYAYAGGGTAAEPYFLIDDARRNDGPFGGVIGCGVGLSSTGPGCQIQGETFVANGIPGPYDEGTVEPGTGPTSTLSQGGEGRHELYTDESPMSHSIESFGDFRYDINDNIVAAFQLRATQSGESLVGPNQSFAPGLGESARPNTFAVTNPYLTPQVQAQLASGNPGCPGGVPTSIAIAPTCMFYFTNDIESLSGEYDPRVPGGLPTWNSYGVNTDMAATADLSGELNNRWDWDVYYTHDEARQKEEEPINTNYQEQYAAEDAVEGADGNPVCYVDTTSYAYLYPNCTPINPFGPTSMTAAQYATFTAPTWYVNTDKMDNLGGSISGNIFDLPAGQVKAALTAETRWVSYGVQSNVTPGFVNCTGLRICSTYTPLWDMGVDTSLAPVSENVSEVSGEVNIPLLKDLPLVNSLAVDLAGRYTDYSISGVAETWKIGFDYHVDDDIMFRGTTSVDIRAPTLNELFQPASISAGTSLNDLLTGKSADLVAFSGGNPNLVPEVGHTYTIGTVLTPSWFPNFTTSVDYYRINLYHAITQLSYTSVAIQEICIKSGGTSPYCTLATRPYPVSGNANSTTTANFPTSINNENLNSATQKTEGVDFEMDYNFDVSDVVDLPGTVALRNVYNYQPYVTNIGFPNAAPVFTPMPKSRDNLSIDYVLNNWDVALKDRWLGGYDQRTTPGQVFLNEDSLHIPNFNQIDMTINRKVEINDTEATIYLSIQDITNAIYPVAPPNLTIGASNPGWYPAPAWAWVLGRYFTIGIRGNL